MAITPTSSHPVSDAAPPQLGTSQPLPSGNDDGTLRINPGVFEQITRATVDVLLELTTGRHRRPVGEASARPGQQVDI